MAHLDLHGVKHHEVEKLVHEHIIKLSQMNAYFSGYIITGNSAKMKEIVKRELNNHDWVNYIDDLDPGRIFITGV